MSGKRTRTTPQPATKRSRRSSARSSSPFSSHLFGLLFLLAITAGLAFAVVRDRYTFTLQSPVRIGFQWPVVIAPRKATDETMGAQADQSGRRLSAWQQYACNKFGPDCRIALAIQRAENYKGACEVYHYNSDGTLDWGYFQINTVHLTRPGLNLRDLLDCRANIDFAYQLYRERGFQPWSTYNNGAYRKYLHSP
jgi:hypothetical protein